MAGPRSETAGRGRAPGPRPSGRRWGAALLIVVPLLFVAGVFGYPLLQIFRLSFTEFLDASSGGVLANYIWFLGSSAQMDILRRTFGVAALVTLACLALGFPYAYLMTLVGSRMRLVMIAFVLLPFWSNLVVRTFAWVVLLRDSGPVQSVLTSMGIEVRLLGATAGVTIGAMQVLLPFLILPLYAGLSGIDRRLLDAAQSLGARPMSAFVKIYLPLAVPGILAGTSIVFILTLGFYFTPALLGSPGNSLVSQQIAIQVSELLAFGRGGAMAAVVLVVTLILMGLVALATRRYTRVLGTETR
ncbi:ABC transporter permease [Aeromicrobium sp. CTD01-1L150]|uniref:ABC transporter permease n=1 Tax=Aeromicrobium sp. CTD01-1L150 TaxID=3341830 RepID=UPI0035C06B54